MAQTSLGVLNKQKFHLVISSVQTPSTPKMGLNDQMSIPNLTAAARQMAASTTV